MKKTLLILSLFAGIGSAYSQNVNIPDANFKAYLVGNASINTNMDTEIQVSEASTFTGTINCPSQSIADLTGIEAFTSLTALYCYNNLSISSLDVSMIPTLEQLLCSSNSITQMDLSNNPNLILLAVDDNELTSLNVANGYNVNIPTNNFYANNNPNLTCIQVDDVAYSTSTWTNIDGGASFSLDCSSCVVAIPDANFKAYLVGNTAINTNMDTEIQCSEATAFTGGINCSGLTISDLTGIEAFTSLTILQCVENQLTDLDVSNNTALTVLYCYNNQLTTLDVSSNTALTYLRCYQNSLTTLNLSNNSALTELSCFLNQITALDLSNNSSLAILNCSYNELTNLNVSANTSLTELFCHVNQLTSLDVSNNTALANLTCDNNQLTLLDVSNNTNLVYFYFSNNQLTSIDLSNHTILTQLGCSGNLLTALNVKNGNNTNFTYFVATNNPNLTCIEVDDATYSTTNWINIDATATFSEDCSAGVGLEEFKNVVMTIYPNPTSSILTIETEAVIESIHIFNLNGTLVQNAAANTFSVESLTNGVYIIHVKTANGIIIERFVKK